MPETRVTQAAAELDIGAPEPLVRVTMLLSEADVNMPIPLRWVTQVAAEVDAWQEYPAPPRAAGRFSGLRAAHRFGGM